MFKQISCASITEIKWTEERGCDSWERNGCGGFVTKSTCYGEQCYAVVLCSTLLGSWTQDPGIWTGRCDSTVPLYSAVKSPSACRSKFTLYQGLQSHRQNVGYASHWKRWMFFREETLDPRTFMHSLNSACWTYAKMLCALDSVIDTEHRMEGIK